LGLSSLFGAQTLGLLVPLERQVASGEWAAPSPNGWRADAQRETLSPPSGLRGAPPSERRTAGGGPIVLAHCSADAGRAVGLLSVRARLTSRRERARNNIAPPDFRARWAWRGRWLCAPAAPTVQSKRRSSAAAEWARRAHLPAVGRTCLHAARSASAVQAAAERANCCRQHDAAHCALSSPSVCLRPPPTVCLALQPNQPASLSLSRRPASISLWPALLLAPPYASFYYIQRTLAGGTEFAQGTSGAAGAAGTRPASHWASSGRPLLATGS